MRMKVPAADLTVAFGWKEWLAMSMPGTVRCTGAPLGPARVKQRLCSTDMAQRSSSQPHPSAASSAL